LRGLLCRCEEELLDARFPVGHAVPHKRQVTLELRIGGNRKVGVGIKRVVNGVAVLRAKLAIVVDDGLSTAVSENEIVLRDQAAKRVLRILFYARKSCWSIDVPKRDVSVGGAAMQDFTFQQFVVCADAAVLDDE